MNTPVPGPPVDGVGPAEIRAAVDAALAVEVTGTGTHELAQQAAMLDDLHRTLSAALDSAALDSAALDSAALDSAALDTVALDTVDRV